MKKIIIMLLAMSAITVSAQSFLGTLAFIESSNNPYAVGDNGKAVGIHNGGPNGWRKSSTIPYLKRFRSARKKGL